MSDSGNTAQATSAPEKSRSTAEADITKYKVRGFCPRSSVLSYLRVAVMEGCSRHRQRRGEKTRWIIRGGRKRPRSLCRRR
jgi:hypothetical protein